jgi:glutamine amidotransferase
MALLAAYLGPEIPLAKLLGFLLPRPTAPPRAEADEAESALAAVAGPYGFGWLGPAGRTHVYTRTSPPWCDHNLPALAEGLQSALWTVCLGEARPAATPAALDIQPLGDGKWLFASSSDIEDEAAAAVLRARLHALLDPKSVAAIAGTALSAYLFALLRQVLAEDDEIFPGEALAMIADLVAEQAADECTLTLNAILADGTRLYALRHALNRECEPLYFSADDEEFPDGLLLASRPLTGEVWQAVPAHHLLVLDQEAPARLLAL